MTSPSLLLYLRVSSIEMPYSAQKQRCPAVQVFRIWISDRVPQLSRGFVASDGEIWTPPHAFCTMPCCSNSLPHIRDVILLAQTELSEAN